MTGLLMENGQTKKKNSSSRHWNCILIIDDTTYWCKHGREWKKCAEHIKTRDRNAVSSHAQKHFIKLYKAGQALPLKVKDLQVLD